ncbi:thioredoxin family protein [Bacillus pacificus]|uniref:thioredoxin family protein n=1 Tax=Bacillus pacificus TaxID=2026187 RepID=UPI00156B0E5D|nr:thioredoxin family protein [Bacillus pacificus]NRR19131.1 thioredoxin family protein [Bacillus pacificus]
MSKKILFSSLVILISIGSLFFIFTSKDLDKPEYTNIDMKEYKGKINSKDNFYIYVYKTSCTACQSTKPFLNEVIKEDKTKVFAINMESEENMDIEFLKKNNIQKTPTLLKYKNGEEMNRVEGIQSKSELKSFLAE